ncbi:hypothetical protein BJ875DRAFT_508295 [Amylocarpus encephaloides]|uniref:Histidine kinase n=1 Tax=Amylocarpus encephaloides TaxID=45428 RepID=A0A9P7Y8Y1_9HELO|nr:hypothetical protein BJ875DRAFT_508295 [Amylocarpus encephaloides]
MYNEAYTALIGNKHPGLQGRDPKVGFAEVWDHFEKLLAKQRETYETVVEADAMLMLNRHGFLEETYFTWKFVPIVDEEGDIRGSYATVVEVTHGVLRDRRLSTIRFLTSRLSEATTIKALWKHIIEGISGLEQDIPLATLYSTQVVRSETRSQSIQNPSETSDGLLECTSEGCIGIEVGNELAPRSVNFNNANETNLGGYFRKASEVMAPIVVPVPQVSQENDWRGYGPSALVVICPIIPKSTDKVLAFLAIALNPCRPYDDDYKDFVNSLTDLVTTSVILSEEIETRQKIARQESLDRERLSKELSESETKFAKLAARAPIGLGIFSPDGRVLIVNELWKKLTTLDGGESRIDWQAVLMPGCAEPVHKAWDRIKWKTPDLDADGKVQYDVTHVMFTVYPDVDANGDIDTIMTCVTDISELKWSEQQLRRKMDQAIQMKRQQERFIDMTSHEMINPLSALIGCADEIISFLREYASNLRQPDVPTSTHSLDSNTPKIELLDEALEAADTIIYCAMHQKRIIEDVPTLSRLDSKLLNVSPEATQPVSLIRSVLKMFEVETNRADTKLYLIEEPSLQQLKVQWTLLDPSRFTQVFVGASPPNPREDQGNRDIAYVCKHINSEDQTTKAGWGDGEMIILTVCVQDTGRGLGPLGIKNLFNIFQQASPKTYVQYGCSGLGLFISRQLVEMQGGEIGVASEFGKGFTFQFYVKTRRIATPTADDKLPLHNDLQFLAREDALREACGIVTSAVQNGPKMSRTRLDYSRPASPSSNGVDMRKKQMHILVVEDNLVNQKVVVKQLRKAGHIVSVANHGQEAMDFIQKSEYWATHFDPVNGKYTRDGSIARAAGSNELLHVVLMDLEMPVMDGLTCLKKIRQYQKEGRVIGHIPIIAVTSNARPDQISRWLIENMDDVTTKPYRIQDMLQQIQKLVSKHTAATDLIDVS